MQLIFFFAVDTKKWNYYEVNNLRWIQNELFNALMNNNVKKCL